MLLEIINVCAIAIRTNLTLLIDISDCGAIILTIIITTNITLTFANDVSIVITIDITIAIIGVMIINEHNAITITIRINTIKCYYNFLFIMYNVFYF